MPRPALRRRARAVIVLAMTLALGLAASADYLIRPGDTLSGIAAHHGTTVSELAALNGISDPNRIIAGQRLRLPSSAGGSATSSAAPASGTHVVQRGETLSGIARHFGLSVSAIASANGIVDPDHIRAGQRLSIPGRSGAGAAPPAASRSQAPATTVPSGQVEALLDSTARRYGVNPALVKAVAWQESGWNQNAVSSAGARGVMQVMPATGQWVSSSLVGRNLDINDTAQNIEAGVAFLAYLQRVTGGDVRMMLAGYYQGLGSVSRNGFFATTERYIANVQTMQNRY